MDMLFEFALSVCLSLREKYRLMGFANQLLRKISYRPEYKVTYFSMKKSEKEFFDEIEYDI
jgi:hypothetical protein